LKGLTRTNEIEKAIHGFIATLEIEEVRAELMQITPSNFVGI
jgi:adenylosuccinate lyase